MQGELGIMMKKLVLAAGLLALVGCESAPEEVPAKEALFVTDDCALLNTIGRDQYKLSADDPQMALRLNGEDATWRPGCDWKGYGFNVIEVAGPEGETATAGMSRLTFHRPRYDGEGALVRTSMTTGAETTYAQCRVVRGGGGWSVESCGPDPKITRPRAAAPSPADQTPDRAAVPLNPDVSPRDAVIPSPDPGERPGDVN